MNKNSFLLLAGLLLVVFAFFAPAIKPDNLITIDIPNPPSDISDEIKTISNIVTDNQDKMSLCIFNKVFADRLIKYETTQQQLNDVYVIAAKNMFNTSIKDKYDNLDTILLNAIRQVTGDDNHTLSDEEKKKIQSNFYSISWYLKK